MEIVLLNEVRLKRPADVQIHRDRVVRDQRVHRASVSEARTVLSIYAIGAGLLRGPAYGDE